MMGHSAVPASLPLDHMTGTIEEFLGISLSLSTPPMTFLPEYLSGEPQSSLERKDIEYLQRKGAFFVPSGRLRQELLRSFICNVYPDMPTRELCEFLKTVTRSCPGRKASLLLFHAVMFVAVMAVREQDLREAGYRSRRAAHAEFFNRVKVEFHKTFYVRRWI